MDPTEVRKQSWKNRALPKAAVAEMRCLFEQGCVSVSRLQADELAESHQIAAGQVFSWFKRQRLRKRTVKKKNIKLQVSLYSKKRNRVKGSDLPHVLNMTQEAVDDVKAKVMRPPGDRFNVLVQMYEKTANRQLAELRNLQRIALQGGIRDTPALRESISTYEKDLEDGLRGILTVRSELTDEHQENEFDAVVEPIRYNGAHTTNKKPVKCHENSTPTENWKFYRRSKSIR
uniref:STX17-like N-terminal domain-containing protein n=1 Tax=Caenorhabditis japonica TaxID=281687 RepID=A0A8R1HPH7_CAEJA